MKSIYEAKLISVATGEIYPGPVRYSPVLAVKAAIKRHPTSIARSAVIPTAAIKVEILQDKVSLLTAYGSSFEDLVENVKALIQRNRRRYT